MENQNSNDRLHLMEYMDYGRIQNVQKARLMAHAAVEEKFNKRLNFITWSTYIMFAVSTILFLAFSIIYIVGWLNGV